jgi:hypothetical protein
MRHYHAFVSFRIESDGNVFVVTFLPFGCNLLNPHLIHFTLFPVGVIVEDLIHRSVAHTIGPLWASPLCITLPSSSLNVNLLDLSINELTKFRFGSVIKSIIQSLQVFILCGTFDDFSITYTNVIECRSCFDL